MYGRTPLRSFSTSRQIVRIHAVGVVAEIDHRHRDHVGGLVEKRDPAVGKMARDLGLEDHVAAVDRRIRHALTDHLDVVGESGRAPQIRHAVAIARIR